MVMVSLTLLNPYLKLLVPQKSPGLLGPLKPQQGPTLPVWVQGQIERVGVFLQGVLRM